MTATPSASTLAFIMSGDEIATPTTNPVPSRSTVSSDSFNGLRLVAVFEAAKGVLVLAVGCGLLG